MQQHEAGCSPCCAAPAGLEHGSHLTVHLVTTNNQQPEREYALSVPDPQRQHEVTLSVAACQSLQRCMSMRQSLSPTSSEMTGHICQVMCISVEGRAFLD